MKQKFVDAYMDVAQRFAQLSSAKRLQVGAIIVKDDRIISIGYNGMPSGWTNECEIEEVINRQLAPGDDFEFIHTGVLTTKEEVIHAEANAIAKLAKCGEAGNGANMFLTHAPCIHCAKQIYTAGITRVYYRNTYRDRKGIDFLIKCGVEVCQELPKETTSQ